MTPTEWLRSCDTGLSSKTIWHHMMSGNLDACDWPNIPLDAGDFGRCFRLLQRFPAWRARIVEMARYPEWKGIAEAWDELERLYLDETAHFYRRISELGRQ